MPRRTHPALLVPLAAAALAVAGCSTVVPGTAYPLGAGPAPAPVDAPAATDDPIAWVDQVCGSILPALQATKNSPSTDYTDAEKTHDAYEDYKRGINDAAGQGLAELDRVGPAPTPHGDEFLAAYRASLVALQQSSSGSGSSAAHPPKPLNAAKLYSEDPELAAATATAKNCQVPYEQAGSTN
jgi:hypothetical protein